MKIVFISNFLNHHQLPVCEALFRLTDGQFRFVANMPINEERLALGYEDMNRKDFVIRAYEDATQVAEAIKWCLESDVMIFGSAPDKYANLRIESGKPLFRYNERLFKDGIIHAYTPRAMKNLYNKYGRHRNKPVFMLCASAYTAMDFHRAGVFEKKAFRWGYFPEVKLYEDIDGLISEKKKKTLLWAGRMLDWKHPDDVIEIANRLKRDGYSFEIKIIGTGEMRETLENMIKEKGLSDCVCLTGAMSPEEVRRHMEESEIFLFTSDRNEGWGAVLNESMNSGCTVVASHIIGSVPFLIENGKNGLIYRDGNIESLYKKVRFLLDNPEKRAEMGKNAYLTLANQWNPQNAAERFYKLAEAVLSGEEKPDIFKDGVCSRAPLLRDGWFKDRH